MTRPGVLTLLCLACSGESFTAHGEFDATGGDAREDAGEPSEGSSGGASGSVGNQAGGSAGDADTLQPCRLSDRVVWSQRVQNTINGGLTPLPETIEHSLRARLPSGFCDELHAADGADFARITLRNGQTGSFGVAIDNLCTAPQYAAGEFITTPGGNEFEKPVVGSYSSVCLHVVESSVTTIDGRYLDWAIDVTWELRAPCETVVLLRNPGPQAGRCFRAVAGSASTVRVVGDDGPGAASVPVLFGQAYEQLACRDAETGPPTLEACE